VRRASAAVVLAAALAAACSAPRPPVAGGAGGRPEVAALDGEPGKAFVRAQEEQRRGVGIPPALPSPGAVDRLSGALRASRPAPGTGPVGPPASSALPVPGNALSRLSALPASPLANPPVASAWGRP
jgi:hypothetical protein